MKMIHQFYRDKKGVRGVLVAIKTADNTVSVGWSMFKRSAEHPSNFSKAYGKELAFKRALGYTLINHRDIRTLIPQSMIMDFIDFSSRAIRYFKDAESYSELIVPIAEHVAEEDRLRAQEMEELKEAYEHVEIENSIPEEIEH